MNYAQQANAEIVKAREANDQAEAQIHATLAVAFATLALYAESQG